MAYSVDTKLAELFNDPKAKAVLVKHVPGISERVSQILKYPGMDMKVYVSLKDLGNNPAAGIAPEKLKAIVADLGAL